jgi:hypothetical protein
MKRLISISITLGIMLVCEFIVVKILLWVLFPEFISTHYKILNWLVKIL